MTHPDNIPEYHELVDALVAMAVQYLAEGPRRLIYEDSSISSDSMCVEALTKLGLLKDREIIDEAFEPGYLEKRFKQQPQTSQTKPDSIIPVIKTRAESARFALFQLEDHDYKCPFEKGRQFHYGKQDLKCLLDFIYGGPPKGSDELVSHPATSQETR